MRKAMIIFIITLILTTLIPMIGMIDTSNSTKQDSASKQMVTIFQG